MWFFNKSKNFENIHKISEEVRILIKQEKWKKAEKLLTHAIDKIAKDCGFNEKMLTQNSIVSILMKNGAEKLPRKDLSFLFCHRGTVYRNMHKFNPAASDYAKAIRLDESNWQAYFLQGNVFVQDLKEDFEAALMNYDIALSLNPQNPDIYYNRGLLHKFLGDFGHAISDFETVLMLNPTHSGSKNNLSGLKAIKRGLNDHFKSSFENYIN